MTVYPFKADGKATHLHPDGTTFSITQPEWGGHVRSNGTNDNKGWVHVPVMIPPEVDGKRLKLQKVDVAYATGWKTRLDAIQVAMGSDKILYKDVGHSHDKVDTEEFAVPGTPRVDKTIEISLLLTMNSGPDEHGRWATVESVGTYLSPV